MSETTLNLEPQQQESAEVRSAGSPPEQLLLDLLERLVSLHGKYDHLVSVPLDCMLTTEQTAEWLQLTAKQVNIKAKDGILPATQIAPTRYRFNPRTIIANREVIYAKRKKRKV